ncbi:hypothetical protein J437_LFUL014198 [Ladona fulva]|uniref:Serine/threonine-protein phosphatase 4 regulatory subunit 2 n=1 Tax=Ladona fulva TaxID=123851 RepID=A0A8K0KG85_LADFU|nr:hypothetical protein J437_LFUL014198 [Ladona fulva]
MENYEELLIVLEEFERTKPKEIPKELEDFIGIVAKTGDPIYPWSKIKPVYRSKIMNVLTQFFEAGPTTDITQFSFDSMKSKILERFDLFRSAPFTIQRLSELLTNPRKEYNRIDKFMRAIEKNILVVSVVEPGCSKHVHLNGSVEMMEEGFQVSSTSVYEEYRQRVAGIMENEVAAASISEDREGEVQKGEGRCKKGEEELRVEEHEQDHKESHSASDDDGENSSQGRIAAMQLLNVFSDQGAMLDHQEFHRLEFSLAETDTLAIVEIVSEVDCPPDGSESAEETSKDYSLGNSMMNDDSRESNEPSDGAILSEDESCDTVTEVVDNVDSVPVDDDMVNDEKVIETEKPLEESLHMDISPPKDESLPEDEETGAKVENQNIDVIDVGSSVNVHSDRECDSEPLTKVLVLSSPTESQLQESMNCSEVCKLEESDKGKEELRYLESDKNVSASEKSCVEEDSDDSDDVESEAMKTLESSNADSQVSPEHTSSVKDPTQEGDSSSCSQESTGSPKTDSS